MPSTTLTLRPGAFIRPYFQIARVSHWFKNVFVLLGALVAFFYDPSLSLWDSLQQLAVALLAACLVASSNYVINELLDGPTDRFHPEKKERPAAAGMVRRGPAIAEWLLLGTAGLAVAVSLNLPFAVSALVLWIMGLVYNVRPFRTKELPYLDVLSESINNPLRLFLGWFAVVPDKIPPLSLVLAYWMVGAFFMATKRFAEYRRIGDPTLAAAYRASLRYYTEERLLVSMFFYAVACAFFGGIFIVRYHVELILFVPVAGGLLAYYLKLGLKENSPVQHPERLYREAGFVAYLVPSTILFVLLMLTQIPVLYDLFNIAPAGIAPLWTIK